MAVEIPVFSLCGATPADRAQELIKLAKAHGTASVTASIDSLVSSGTLPAQVYRAWLTVARDPETIVAALRQTHSASVRGVAIKIFGKMLRSADHFLPVWNAAGGARGLAGLMSEFSVVEVKQMCKTLGHTGSGSHVREERQKKLTDLTLLLLGQEKPDDEPATETSRPDPRPFRRFYGNIVPGCTDEMILLWERRGEDDWPSSMTDALRRVHQGRYEAKFLDEIFSPAAKNVTFASGQHLFYKNLPLSEQMLSKLSDSQGNVRVPTGFMPLFAEPLLTHLFQRRRFDDQYRAKIIGLVVNCAKNHETIADTLMVDKNGLFGLTLRLWNRNKDQRQYTEEILRTLVKILPASAIRNIRHVVEILERVKLELRRPLLHLILQQAKPYGFDIDDLSDETIDRLRELPTNDRWPSQMFTKTLDYGSGLALFQLLMKADPDADFLDAGGLSSSNTILSQTKSPENARGDPEILHCLLIRYSLNGQQDSEWLRRAESLIDERRKKAAQAPDWDARAFWAKSALRLCVGAGLLKQYGETLLWARRFNKHPLTVREIFGCPFAEETERLLCAVPLVNGEISSEKYSFKEGIDRANQVLIQLLETAGMATVEPGFQPRQWVDVFGLPKRVVELRIRRIGKFQTRFKVTDQDAADMIWKPTIRMVIQADAMMQKPEFGSVSPHNSAWRFGLVPQIIDQVFDTSAPALVAQLTTFWLKEMNEILGPVHTRQHLRHVIPIIQGLGKSDQPPLACSFIRDFILDDEANSAWHRSLLNVGFLSALPARTAKDFLRMMASAIAEKMQEQNARPLVTQPEGSPPSTQPIVKVTTVKMLARVLDDTLFIDPASACDILIGLFTQARHSDIQTAIVESLLSKLADSTSSASLRKHILDSLERYAVPIAAQLSQRWPLPKADWFRADSAKALPEVSDDTSMRGVSRRLLDGVGRSSLVEEDRRRLASLVMDAAMQSAGNNARWVQMFLRTHNFDLGTGVSLPAVPVESQMLGELLKRLRQYTPRPVFEMLKEYLLVNLNPPASVVRVTRAVKDNKDLMNSNAGKHWLSLFGATGVSALKLGGYECAAALHTGIQRHQSKVADGITTSMLQECVVEMAEALIAVRDPDGLDELTSALLRRYRESAENWTAWNSNTLPVLKQIVAKVDKIDREEWQQESDKKMPSSFRLRTRILAFPFATDTKACAPRKEVDAFVAELLGLINGLASRRLPYHEDWGFLKTTVANGLRGMDLMHVAVGLGSVGGVDVEAPSLGDYLRVELASDLLIKVVLPPRDKEAVVAARKMVQSWRDSPVENFRTVAIQARGQLTTSRKGERSWFSGATDK